MGSVGVGRKWPQTPEANLGLNILREPSFVFTSLRKKIYIPHFEEEGGKRSGNQVNNSTPPKGWKPPGERGCFLWPTDQHISQWAPNPACSGVLVKILEDMLLHPLALEKLMACLRWVGRVWLSSLLSARAPLPPHPPPPMHVTMWGRAYELSWRCQGGFCPFLGREVESQTNFCGEFLFVAVLGSGDWRGACRWEHGGCMIPWGDN